MAENTKIYKLVINGVQESVNAVESLNKQLELLDSRMKKVEAASSVVKTSSSTSGGSSKSSSLNEEAKLLKQISQLEDKRVATEKDIYQNYLAAKDVLAETVSKQKEIAAQERLSADRYSKNTMQGMKQELSDIKKVMQTTDMASDRFKELVKRANELTNSLKKTEEQYGQFGRNVGNYKSAAYGFKGLSIEVAGTVHEFDNAKQALMTFKKELTTLQVKKDQGLGLSEEELQRYEELANIVPQIRSSIEDAGKPMDDLMDTMQSFVALAQAGKGIAAFFDIDDGHIEQTIKDLVALQNAMQGLQTIQKQLQTEEGLGKYFKGASDGIDKFVNKLFGLEKATKAVASAEKAQADATTAVATAEKKAATAAEVQTAANGAMTISMRVATVAAKALSFALKAIGIGFVLEGLAWAVEGFKTLASSLNTSKIQAEGLDKALEGLNQTYAELIDQNNKLYDRGKLSYMEYFTNQLELQNELLERQIAIQREKEKVEGNNEISWGVGDKTTQFGQQITGSTTFETSDLMSSFKFDVENLEEAKDAFWKIDEALKDGKDYFDKWGEGIKGWWDSVWTTMKDTKELQQDIGKGILNDFVGKVAEASKEYEAAMNDMKNGAEGAAERLQKAKQKVEELNKELYKKNGKGIIDVLERMDDENIKKKFRGIIDVIKMLKNELNARDSDVENYFQNLAIEMLPDREKAHAQLKKQQEKDIKQYGDTEERIAKINAYYKKKNADVDKQYNKKSASTAKQHAKEIYDIEMKLMKARIDNMEEGIEKKLALLDYEKKQELKDVKEGSELYNEIQKKYQNKSKDLTRDWTREQKKAYRDMWKDILAMEHENATKQFELQQNGIESNRDKLLNQAANNSGTANQGYSSKNISLVKNKSTYKVLEENDIAYTKRLEQEYEKRSADLKKYLTEVENIQITAENQRYETSLAALTKAENDELRTLNNSYEDKDEALEKQVEKGLITKKQYNEASARLEQERATKELNIQSEYTHKREQEEKTHQKNLENYNKESNDAILRHFQETIAKFQEIDTSEPVRNGFGIVNLKKTKERNNRIIEDYKKFSQELQTIMEQLQHKLESEDLTAEQRKAIQALIEQLKALGIQVNTTMKQISNNTRSASEELKQNLLDLGEAMQDIANSVIDIIGSIQDAAYEEEIEHIDKQLELAQEMYNKMDDAAQEHANNMRTIEQQIAQAQGDARTRLIQRYQEEKRAQKEALAQKKKAEKEEQKLNQKKEKLEKEQKEREKKRSLIQAAINTAMAITYASMNTWPMPALAMVASAAALGAAQIAAIASQTYGQGGQLEGGLVKGKRHSEGGVPVGNTGIFVEGEEMIVRRESTIPNVELLEYINDKKRKLNLGDFIDFYTNGKVKSNVKGISPSNIFAEGGQIPTLQSVDINDRMMTVLQDYSKKPTVVQVVDIIDRMQDVNEVRTLAGLS